MSIKVSIYVCPEKMIISLLQQGIDAVIVQGKRNAVTQKMIRISKL